MVRYFKDIYQRLIHIEGKIDEFREGRNFIITDIHERIANIENKIDEAIKLNNNEDDSYYCKSYAQFGEDVTIYNLFKIIGITKPSYIDIGANHPYMISNTALMHDMGCVGVNVEANPNLVDAFITERPNDINLCCGVAGRHGEMPFYMVDDWSGRNSFNKTVVDQFVFENPKFKIKEVKSIEVFTLQEIVDKIGGRMPDYMSLDVESMEWEILSSYDLKCNGPLIMTVEISEMNKEQLIDYILNAGYILYLKIENNYTFLKEYYKERVMR